MINRLSILAVLTFALASRSFAAIPFTVGNIYNTGYTPTTTYPGAPVVPGVALSPGSSDLFFNLYSAYPAPFTGQAIIVPQAEDGPGWVVPVGGQWIGPVENESGNSSTSSPTPEGGLAGVYDYSADFSSNFLVPTQVTMLGSFAADDTVSLVVNGTLVETVPAEAYGSLTPIDYTFTVDAKESILPIDFVVYNTANGGSGSTNPTGLLVSDLRFVTGTASAPEPSTWALMIGGLALLVVIQRRRLASII
jgi:hypothetical protein